MNFRGVILAYAKEIVLENNVNSSLNKTDEVEMIDPYSNNAAKDLQQWKEGTMKTVEMTNQGDFVALKFSGAGENAMYRLAAKLAPSKAMKKATIEICDLAKAKQVRLLFDAEQKAVQDGIDAWTLDFQRKYNGERAVIFGTYQAYLHSTPTTLGSHLRTAQNEGFYLGVKLVRGAYMNSEPRSLFWESKEHTDRAYDGIAESLIKRQWNNILQSPDGSRDYPHIGIVLATHNRASVKKALKAQEESQSSGHDSVDVSHGQLMGMADEVSFDLVLRNNVNRIVDRHGTGEQGPHTYKYVVWGSVGECLKYLVRRAEENRDAVTRAKESRASLKEELLSRIGFK